MFGVCLGTGSGATLWLELLLLPLRRRDNGRYAVAVTLCAVMAACLEGERQDKAILCLGILYVCLTSSAMR